jgi:hypothetical protein
MRQRRIVIGALGLLAAMAGGWLVMAEEKPSKQAPHKAAASKPIVDDEDIAVERARKQVRMLDDLYKTAVVLITTHYVEEDSDLAAGPAAKALFAAMKEKGWHEVRLVDATGLPIEEENSPADAFEKEAIRRLKSGEAYYDEVIEIDGQRKLRAATIIPVVLEKCTLCHDHYNQAKEGEAIGALCYTLDVE